MVVIVLVRKLEIETPYKKVFACLPNDVKNNTGKRCYLGFENANCYHQQISEFVALLFIAKS